jgi:hypothetical protein
MENSGKSKGKAIGKKPEGLSHIAGDLIERLGEFVQRAGATEWGQKIYRYGNKLEHMNDKKAQRK